MATRIKMTKKNRLAILTHARKLIDDRKHWTKRTLRRRTSGGVRYCVLGACEQAAYELGLAEPNKYAFRTTGSDNTSGIGYALGRELSLYEYSKETFGVNPDSVNDRYGYEMTLEMLDGYIAEVKAGRPRKEA